MKKPHPLTAVSPLDGRYADKTRELCPVFSEYGLIRNRVRVEVAWVQALAEHTDLLPHSDAARSLMDSLVQGFSVEDAERVKALESETNHDVKAVEYFLQERFREQDALRPYVPFLHFACTSEDINNLAYALMLREGRDDVLAPSWEQALRQLGELAKRHRAVPMLCRTHGQAATPSTMGKELGVFAHRLRLRLDALRARPLYGKMNGATGNFNAHIAACPEVDWMRISEGFVTALGLQWNPHTTQIESHDYIAGLLDEMALGHRVLMDLCRDVWGYVSLGYFRQRMVDAEVGSSTMPHKINPIDFENAEGNFSMANAIARQLSETLPLSRWQRDLTDSTTMRNLGTVFAYAGIALRSLSRGLDKLDIDEERIRADLADKWQLLAEPVQTVMRRHGIEDAYEQLKQATRGKQMDRAAFHDFVQGLEIPEDAKQGLLELTPEGYVGNAAEQADQIVRNVERS